MNLASNVVDLAQKLRKLPYQGLLPLIFFCLGLLYIYAAPNFEASDTDEHVGMIRWIAEQGKLPVQSEDHDELHGQQASQPPLYYAAMSLVWRLFDTSDFAEYFQENPLVLAGVPERLGNRNTVFYRQPYPPDLRGTSLALYTIRVLTLAMGAVTVYAVYQSARTALPESIAFAVLAASLTAFNPMFIFISTSVSNDPLVSMLAALVTWQTLVILRHGFDARRSLILALLIALASLAKLSGLAPGAVAGLAALWVLQRTRDWRGFLILSAAVLLVWLAVAGWWFARNIELYGELFGTGAMLDHFGRRSLSLQRLLIEEFEGLRISFWALFGAFSILVHRFFYLAMDGLSFLGVAGLLVHLARVRRQPFALAVVAVLGITLAIGGVMLIWWTLQTTASTGRLLFPYITSISVLLALGLHRLRVPAPLIALPMFVFALSCPVVTIIPQYNHPPQVAELPASATSAFAQWEDIALVGYETPTPRRWSAGDEIPLTLYWRPRARSNELQALFITLIDARGEKLATIDSFPGWGTLPTTWWQPGAIYRDDYIVQIPDDAEAFSSVQLHIGWYDWADRIDILPLLESGDAAPAFSLPIGALVASDARQTLGADATPDGTVYGDALQLNAYRFSAGHILELEWEVLRAISGDLRAFAIVLDQPYREGTAFQVILQDDQSAPVDLDFLNEGERFSTRHVFQLPEAYEGEHGIYVGWYNEELGIRLAAPYPQNMLALPNFAFRAVAD